MAAYITDISTWTFNKQYEGKQLQQYQHSYMAIILYVEEIMSYRWGKKYTLVHTEHEIGQYETSKKEIFFITLIHNYMCTLIYAHIGRNAQITLYPI